MNNKLRLSLWVMLLVVVSVGGSGCSTVRQHKNFAHRSKEIRSVTVVPPEIMITRLVFKGDDETLFEESATASRVAQQTLELEFAKKGYEVRPFKMRGGSAQEYEMSQLKDRYNALLGDVDKHYLRKLKWKGFDLNLGSGVNQFADQLDADILVFSSGAGFVKSGGEIAKSIAKTALIAAGSLGTVVYVENQSGGQIHVSVVDGDNGEILWHNFSNPNVAYNLTKEKPPESMTRSAITKFPRSKITAGIEMPEEEVLEHVEEPYETDFDVDGVSRRKVNIPYEGTKVVAKTTQAAGEAGLDLTEAALKASLDVGKAVPKAAFNLITLGAYRESEGDKHNAIKAYKAALKKDSKNPYTHMLLAHAYLNEGKDKKARKHARRAVAIDPDVPGGQELLDRLS